MENIATNAEMGEISLDSQQNRSSGVCHSNRPPICTRSSGTGSSRSAATFAKNRLIIVHRLYLLQCGNLVASVMLRLHTFLAHPLH